MEHELITPDRLANLDLSQPPFQTIELLYPELQLAIIEATDLFATHGQRYPLQYIRPRPPALFLRPGFVAEAFSAYEGAIDDRNQDAVDVLLTLLMPALAPAIDGLLSALCNQQHTDRDYWFACDYLVRRWRKLTLSGPQFVCDKHDRHTVWWNGEYRSTVPAFSTFAAYSPDIERHLDRLRDTVLDSFDSAKRLQLPVTHRLDEEMDVAAPEVTDQPFYELNRESVFARLDRRDREVCELSEKRCQVPQRHSVYG